MYHCFAPLFFLFYRDITIIAVKKGDNEVIILKYNDLDIQGMVYEIRG